MDQGRSLRSSNVGDCTHRKPECKLTYTASLSGTYCDWYPTSNLTYGNDYTLMLQQNTFTTLSLAFSIGNATSSASATAAATTTMTSSAAASSAVAPVATPPATSTLPVNIVNPTPTSSFDAPVEADTHLTVNDKIAIGIGIPIALLVLGTIGYWRAVKFYFHRKVTGESKLPMFDKSGVAPPTIVVGSGLRQSSAGRNSTWSNAPSLWGANSRRSSRAGPERSDDTELLTAPPKSVHSSPRPPRDSSVGSIRSPSALRQEWHPL